MQYELFAEAATSPAQRVPCLKRKRKQSENLAGIAKEFCASHQGLLAEDAGELIFCIPVVTPPLTGRVGPVLAGPACHLQVTSACSWLISPMVLLLSSMSELGAPAPSTCVLSPHTSSTVIGSWPLLFKAQGHAVLAVSPVTNDP